MLFIKNESKNPYFNLALEEYALKELNVEDDFFILWQNENTIVVGRNQNTIEEINSKNVRKNHTNVARRMSGGGAVYHDLGNVNYTFITRSDDDSKHNFKKFTKPVIDALESLGIEAEFTGRNDITVNDKKISGNAQYYHQNKMLHHGTILFDVNTEKEYVLSSEDLENIEKLAEEKYSTWEWVYGESPKFELQQSKRYKGGNIDIRLNVKDGNIMKIKIFGDFFGKKDISEVEELIVNNKFEESNIRGILKDLDFNDYFLNISLDEFLESMFSMV